MEYGYSGMWKLTRRRDHRGVVNFRYDREERLRLSLIHIYLKRLWQQGKLKREWKNRQYYYTLAATGSKTVSQSPMTDPQTAL